MFIYFMEHGFHYLDKTSASKGVIITALELFVFYLAPYLISKSSYLNKIIFLMFFEIPSRNFIFIKNYSKFALLMSITKKI